jgi:aryl-alcohol dehydrogenase-like predicted oxidoreductase
MKLRPFGDTGMNVSEIGLGAWQLANPEWGISDKKEALNIVQKSLEAGCNFFDTAPSYGRGVSEELIGQVLKSVRKDIIICTKFGHTAEGVTDFSPPAIRPSIEASLRRLQTDYLDIVLMHNPPREMMDGRVAMQYEEFEKLKAEGVIREYGISLDWQAESAGSVLQRAISGAIACVPDGAGTWRWDHHQSAAGFGLAFGTLSRKSSIRRYTQTLVT